jgi:Wzt C-terminal domain/Sulfotransferase family
MKRTMFCHVRKTGGTTLHRIFQNAVGENQVSPGHGSERYSNALNRWEGLKVISQHIWFAPGEALSNERVHLTVLRDPVDRCVSNYFYVKAQENIFRADALERSLSLSEFAASESAYTRAEFENHQTKLFAPIKLPMELTLPSEDQLFYAAKMALDEFEIVGLTERLEETVDLISYVTGMAPLAEIPRERATKSRLSLDDVPQEVRRRLKKDNRLDEELYAYASKRFRAVTRKSFFTLLDLERNTLATDSADVAAPVNRRESRGARLSLSPTEPLFPSSRRFGSREIEVEHVHLSGNISLGAPDLISGETLSIKILCRSKIDCEGVTVGVHIHDGEGRLVYGTNIWNLGKSVRAVRNSVFEVVFQFQVAMGVGRYRVGASLHTGNSHIDQCFDWCDDFASFGVVGVTGFHFDGTTRLVPSITFKCDRGDAHFLDRQHAHGSFVSLGRHNRPIKPDGYVCSVAKEISVRCGDIFGIELEIANDGDIPWEEDGQRCVKLCYRWLGDGGSVLVDEGERNNIGGDLSPGDRRRLWITVKAPPNHVGSAILRVTLLQEHVAWFDHLGKLCCDISATILGAKSSPTVDTSIEQRYSDQSTRAVTATLE